MRKILTVGAVAVFALSGCAEMSSDYSTESPNTNLNGVRYSVVTDWTRIPADNDHAYDTYIRILKIEDLCYIQADSAYDSGFNLTPHAATC